MAEIFHESKYDDSEDGILVEAFKNLFEKKEEKIDLVCELNFYKIRLLNN